LKCHPEKVEQLKSTKGFLPAYHMNKEHWLTVPLTGAVPLGVIKSLLKESFELTK
jgi:predicted DNA-binding protein (MmcQ/YjbR family)